MSYIHVGNLFYRRSSSIIVAVDSIESILSEAIKLEFEAYGARSAGNTSRQLNEAERAKLNELIIANKALLAPLDDDLSTLVGEDCRFKVSLEKTNLYLFVAKFIIIKYTLFINSNCSSFGY